MILLSLGTHQQPFPRALDLIEPLAMEGKQILIQHGSTPPRPQMPNTTWAAYMAFEDLVDAMITAESVVCHAGVGTIMTAVKSGHTPVVIPRQPGRGEHIDNHQLDIANCYAEQGLVRCVTSETDLAPMLTPRSNGAGSTIGKGSTELRDAVAAAVAQPSRRGRLSLRLR